MVAKWTRKVVSSYLASRSGKSCKLPAGAAADWTSCSSISHRCSVGLRSGEFGGHSNTLNSLFCSSNHSRNTCAVWWGAFSCWKRPLPWGHTVAMKGFVFGPQWLLGRCNISNWHLCDHLDQGIINKTQPRASHRTWLSQTHQTRWPFSIWSKVPKISCR